MSRTMLLPFQPEAMTPAQLAAVSFLARYSGHTHELYALQRPPWFEWCERSRPTSSGPAIGLTRSVFAAENDGYGMQGHSRNDAHG